MTETSPGVLGPLLVDIATTTLSVEDKDVLTQNCVGGVILFSRNFSSMEQLQELVSEIKSLRQPELLVMVDHEGGRVQRFKEGFTRIPAMAELGELYESEPEQAKQLTEQFAWLIAKELLACGIDLNLGPVLDIDWHHSKVLASRSFGHELDSVVNLAIAYLRGLQGAGMTAVGKHFPGHGFVREDSHLELPQDARSLDVLLEQDSYPYARLLPEGLQAVMTAHIVYPAIDTLPVTYSQRWLKDILRQRLGFDGVVLSDDLMMQGAVGQRTPLERVKLALQAGCDFVLLCNDRTAVLEILAAGVSEQYSPEPRLAELLRGRSSTLGNFEALSFSEQWKQARQAVQQLVPNEVAEEL